MHHNKDCVQFCYVGDHLADCILVLFCDAGFAGDLKDSKSTGGSFCFLLGKNTCVPLSWACKKQGAVSHSSTEAEIITLDMGLRTEGMPQITLWEEIIRVMCRVSRPKTVRKPTFNGMYDILANVDYVPTTLPDPTDLARLVVMEDNDAVIKMIIKGRTNKFRHVPRTHRIDLDWLLEVIREDPGICIKYINTKMQVADVFTKGQFTTQQWQHLSFMCMIAKTRNRNGRKERRSKRNFNSPKE